MAVIMTVTHSPSDSVSVALFCLGSGEMVRLTSNPTLNTVPNALCPTCQTKHCKPTADERPYRHGSPVKHRPQGTPYAKGRPRHDRERDMILGDNATGGTDKGGRNEVADPDADPGLPPREQDLAIGADDHGRGDHPRILPIRQSVTL